MTRPHAPHGRAAALLSIWALGAITAAAPAAAQPAAPGRGAVCTPTVRRGPVSREGVAVIYFAGRGRGTGAEPLAEAVTRGVTERLSQGRTAAGRPLRIVTAFPGQPADQTYFLSGTVALNMGDTVQIAARLSTAADGAERWNASVRRHVLRVDEAVEEVARAVASRVGARLPAPVPAPRPSSTSAFTRFLEGRYLSRQFDAANLQRAIDAFTAATRDSGYPLARAELAEAYARAARWGTSAPTQTLALSGIAAARQAIVVPTQPAAARSRAVAAAEVLRTFLPPGGTSTGTLSDDTDGWRARAMRALRAGDAAGAEAALRRAVARDPHDAEALTELGDLLLVQSRDAEACRILERAVSADPRIAPAYALRAVALVREGRRGGNAGAVRAGFADAEVATQLGRPVWGEAAWSVVQLASRDTAGARATARTLVSRLRTERVGYWDARLMGEAFGGLRDTLGLRLLRERLPEEDPRRTLLARTVGLPARAARARTRAPRGASAVDVGARNANGGTTDGPRR